MNVRALWFLPPLALAAVGAGATEVYSVHDLHEQCIAKDRPQLLACAGYIRGVGDTMLVAGDLSERSHASYSLAYCPGEGVTIEQSIAVFVGWHDRNPANWNKAALLGVIYALQEAWPCKPAPAPPPP